MNYTVLLLFWEIMHRTPVPFTDAERLSLYAELSKRDGDLEQFLLDFPDFNLSARTLTEQEFVKLMTTTCRANAVLRQRQENPTEADIDPAKADTEVLERKRDVPARALTDIDGIGPVYAEHLHDVEIHTIEDLAQLSETDPRFDQLVDLPGITDENLRAWIADARG